jgi:hypothetical protein
MTYVPSLSYKTTTKSVQDIQNLFQRGQLNLEPGFQRQSVWNVRDRSKLIDSILRNYPLPAIFLYKRQDQGELVFDVIDGKQRLESLMFMGLMRGRYPTRTQLSGSGGSYTWRRGGATCTYTGGVMKRAWPRYTYWVHA